MAMNSSKIAGGSGPPPHQFRQFGIRDTPGGHSLVATDTDWDAGRVVEATIGHCCCSRADANCRANDELPLALVSGGRILGAPDHH